MSGTSRLPWGSDLDIFCISFAIKQLNKTRIQLVVVAVLVVAFSIFFWFLFDKILLPIFFSLTTEIKKYFLEIL